MGAWGYGYKENDEYHNEGPTIVEAGIDVMHETFENFRVGKYSDGSGAPDTDLTPIHIANYGRPLFMATIDMMKGPGFDGFDLESIEKMRRALSDLETHALSDDMVESYQDSERYRMVVTGELTSAREYLDQFEESSFLADRIGSISQAFEGGL